MTRFRHQVPQNPFRCSAYRADRQAMSDISNRKHSTEIAFLHYVQHELATIANVKMHIYSVNQLFYMILCVLCVHSFYFILILFYLAHSYNHVHKLSLCCNKNLHYSYDY